MVTRTRQLTCVRCGEQKEAAHFVNDRTRSSGKFPWCKPCVLESRRDARKRPRLVQPTLDGIDDSICPGCEQPLGRVHANRRFCGDPCKEKVRRWKTFGLEPDEYRKLVAAQNGKCPICRKNVRKWVIDHNHATGETTGVTCQICNQALLAYTKHDPEVARRLAAYLDAPPVRAMFGERRYVGPEAVSNLDRMWGWAQAAKKGAA